jgi:hypothetical protein
MQASTPPLTAEAIAQAVAQALINMAARVKAEKAREGGNG